MKNIQTDSGSMIVISKADSHHNNYFRTLNKSNINNNNNKNNKNNNNTSNSNKNNNNKSLLTPLASAFADCDSYCCNNSLDCQLVAHSVSMRHIQRQRSAMNWGAGSWRYFRVNREEFSAEIRNANTTISQSQRQ